MADFVEYAAEPDWLGMVNVGSIVASAVDIPVKPPRQWFDKPGLTHLTPLTVEGNGRVFGHIASWEGSHIGRLGKVKPPRSKSQYRYFMTGELETEDGSMVPVGQITMVGGHAPLHASAKDAVAHYDNTQSAVMDVTCGEDDYGIWVAGGLRPDVDDLKMRTVRASSVSGDWRPIDNSLELVAICSVNVPGFPIPRALAASGGGEGHDVNLYALVAAGTEPLVTLAHEDTTLQAVRYVIEDMESKMSWMRTAMSVIASATMTEDDFDWGSVEDDMEVVTFAEAPDDGDVEDVVTMDSAPTENVEVETLTTASTEDGADSEDDVTDTVESPVDEAAGGSDSEREAPETDVIPDAKFTFMESIDRTDLAQEILAAGDADLLWRDGLPIQFSQEQVESVALRLRRRNAMAIDVTARQQALTAGAAMPDGRLPILDEDDLRRAVVIVPDDTEYHAHLERRAHALGLDLKNLQREALVAAFGGVSGKGGESFSKKAPGGSWQLRDRKGQWIDMNADVKWFEHGVPHTGKVIDSPKDDWAIVKGDDGKEYRLPGTALTVKPKTGVKASGDLASMSMEERIALREVLTAGGDKYDFGTRLKMSKAGTAMPGGAYPIADKEDLANAIQAIGRAKDQAATRAWIMKRARALNAVDLLPEKWKD